MSTTSRKCFTRCIIQFCIRNFTLSHVYIHIIHICFTGSIPGPVFVGAVIDRACELWQGDACGGDGVCMLYNKRDLSLNVMLWWVILTCVTSCFFIIALIFATRGAKGSFTLKK